MLCCVPVHAACREERARLDRQLRLKCLVQIVMACVTNKWDFLGSTRTRHDVMPWLCRTVCIIGFWWLGGGRGSGGVVGNMCMYYCGLGLGLEIEIKVEIKNLKMNLKSKLSCRESWG